MRLTVMHSFVLEMLLSSVQVNISLGPLIVHTQACVHKLFYSRSVSNIVLTTGEDRLEFGINIPEATSAIKRTNYNKLLVHPEDPFH